MNNKISIKGSYYGYDELVDSEVASQIVGLKPRTLRDMATRRELGVFL